MEPPKLHPCFKSMATLRVTAAAETCRGLSSYPSGSGRLPTMADLGTRSLLGLLLRACLRVGHGPFCFADGPRPSPFLVRCGALGNFGASLRAGRDRRCRGAAARDVERAPLHLASQCAARKGRSISARSSPAISSLRSSGKFYRSLRLSQISRAHAGQHQRDGER